MDDATSANLLLFGGVDRVFVLAGDRTMSTGSGTATARHADPASQRRWGRRLGRLLSGVIVGLAILLGYYTYRSYFSNPRTDDAYVHANTAALAAHVSGAIIRLPLRDNQRVTRGDLLFVVDPRPYQLALNAARTKLSLTVIEIKTLHDTIGSAKAQMAARKVDAANARQYLARILPLRNGDFVTENEVVEARDKVEATEAGVATEAAELAKAQDGLGMSGNVNQRLAAAQEAVEDARLNYNYCFVRAPFDGFVTNLNIAEGQYANIGQPVLTLIDDRNWYVLAYFREDLLDRIRPGMPVDVALLSYPGQSFRGAIEGVGWGLFQQNGATVGGLPNVEETLNWVRLNQRFPVRILLQRDREHPFRIGQTAVVTVRGG
jgi:multidrug resistance efflux pump